MLEQLGYKLDHLFKVDRLAPGAKLSGLWEFPEEY